MKRETRGRRAQWVGALAFAAWLLTLGATAAAWVWVLVHGGFNL